MEGFEIRSRLRSALGSQRRYRGLRSLFSCSSVADKMATYAYREQALIELVAETSTARRELSSVSKVGKQFQLDQMKASLEAQSHIDKASRKTFKNLEDDLKSMIERLLSNRPTLSTRPAIRS